jgi:DNA repair exonuclease SbcCD ATPase subunit
MITRVLLRNWRGYEKLALDFGPGLTFVIADNGVGKTSLVNGVAWAIFGDASGIDGQAAIRAGTDRTVAEVDLVVGDTTFTVTRSLERRPQANGASRRSSSSSGSSTSGSRGSGRGRHTLTVAMNGTPTESVDLPRRLSEVATLPPDVLPQLMFVPEMRLTHEGELFADVQDHLAALLGIDDLRRAVRAAEDAGRAADRELRAAKEVVRVNAATVEAATAKVRRLQDEIDRLDEELAADAEARDRLEAERRTLDDWAVHDDRTARYEARLDELAEQARAIGLTADAEARDRLEAERRTLDDWAVHDDRTARYEARLDELAEQARAIGLTADAEEVGAAAEELTAESRRVNADLAAVDAEQALVVGLVEQLDEADAVCPVCLRPIDEDVADHAAEAHRTRLAELEARQAETERRRSEVDAAAQQIVALASALVRQRPPAAPEGPRPEHDEATLLTHRAELDAAIAAKNSRKGALGEQLRQAEQTIAEAEQARSATAELTRLHAVVATAGSLAELAAAEADARTERSLRPISQALASRWSEHFVASAARPRLAGGGTIELGQGDVTIPYGSFSGGEKTLASLLTRLLFVTSATGLRSMWLDEPLEHLDPANRTRVARLLAQVTRPGSHLGQVVVTTYEEGLARSMVERHEATNVVYVSTDELL